MSTLIDYLQQRTEEYDHGLLAYFYCDFRNPETRDPINLAGSLLAQICFKLRSFPESLEAAFDICKISQSPYGRQTNLDTITEVLIEIASAHRVTILVDGLDECERRRDILRFFRHLGLKGLHVHILVSS